MPDINESYLHVILLHKINDGLTDLFQYESHSRQSNNERVHQCADRITCKKFTIGGGKYRNVMKYLTDKYGKYKEKKGVWENEMT